MNGFLGFVPLETTTFGFPIQVTDADRAPASPDAQPSYRIYGPSGGTALVTGTASNTDTDSQTGFRFATNVAITSANGFEAGKTYFVRAAYSESSDDYVEVGSFTVT